MSCDRVHREDIVEKYVRDVLPERVRDAFEEHYFGCARCLDQLRTVRTLQQELAAGATTGLHTPHSRQRRAWRWAVPLAAVVVVGVVGLWTRNLGPTVPPERSATPTARPPEPPPPAATPVAALAQVEPAPYAPSRVRAPADEATRRFREAMKRYSAGDYAGALPGLQEAARSNPEAPDVAFFLGVTSLLAGDRRTAADALARTIALGDTPFLEDAHYYMAQAHLLSNDAAAATRELQAVIELREDHAAAAKALLDKLSAIPTPP